MTRASENETYDLTMWDSAMKITREEECSIACLMNKDCRLSYVKRDGDGALCFMVNELVHGYAMFDAVIFKKTCRSGQFELILREHPYLIQ